MAEEFVPPEDGKVSQYMSRWKLWVFDPDQAAQVEKPAISTFQFFTGNIIGGLIGFLSVSFILAAELKNLKLSVSEALNDSGVFGLLVAIFGTYIDTVVIGTLISAGISFGMFRVSGSTVSFKKHLGRYFELSFLEPAACLFFSYALISAVSKSASSMVVFIALALLWVATRIWYCKVSWAALLETHDLPPSKYKWAYWFGHIPAFLMTNMTLGSMAWGVAGFFIVGSK